MKDEGYIFFSQMKNLSRSQSPLIKVKNVTSINIKWCLLVIALVPTFRNALNDSDDVYPF